MEIRILGAHNVESATSKLVSLLVDDVLAVDVGSLTSSLSLEEQQKVSNILLTHCHYDHVRDLAAVALNISY
jgi:ribonuclease BN (tRNA processing enzyme)